MRNWQNQSKRIAVTIGDPAGIGAEVSMKGYSILPFDLKRRIVLFGNLDYLLFINELYDMRLNLVDTSKVSYIESDRDLMVENVKMPEFKISDFAKNKKEFAIAAIDSIKLAYDKIIKSEIAAMVTAPINKSSLKMAGFNFPGHTEYLQHISRSDFVVMGFLSDQLSVGLVTTHHPIKDIPELLSKALILKTIEVTEAAIMKIISKRPKIAIAALNPHGSDNSTFGTEERDHIIPAVKEAQEKGIDISGPYPADTLFSSRVRKQFDFIIGIYHDQALIPLKALQFGQSVNITLGLPFLRVSVDHGTAFDIAGKNKADYAPMEFAIKKCFELIDNTK